MGNYADLKNRLAASRKTWLVTGVAGFIGSNLLETLLTLDQRVFGLDDFSTGKRRNREDVRQLCGSARWLNFRLIEGTIMLVAARDAGVRRFVYATSSATYGDDPADLKIECTVGRPLSPYAVTKCVDELYAYVFAQCYGFETIGLRYFNVFGPR